MKVENMNIAVSGDTRNPIEFVFREGQAEKIDYPVKYKTNGLITAPAEFGNRISDKSKSIVEYSIPDLWILLKEDPNSEVGSEIKGEVTINPDLVAFQINKERKFSAKELQKFAVKYAHCFKSIDDAKQLRHDLMNFEATFEKSHVKTDDRSGNKEESVKEAIRFSKGEIKKDWLLNMPLYLGHDNVEINIQVEIDSEGASPVFSFWSIDLEVKMKEEGISIINAELMKLKGFTCLQIR